MLGIENEVIEYHLRVSLKAKKVQRKQRSFSTAKYVAIVKEVDRLLAAGFIKEAHYPEWLFNVVLVKKSNDKWRIFVNVTNLNRMCLKDIFPCLVWI